MKIYKEHIESFIPQRAPFVMVDNLIDATADTFTTDFEVLSDNIFIEDGVLREFALIENIAQSSAAGLGYLNLASKVRPIDGFIGGISKLNLYSLPKVNDKIETKVTLVRQLNNMYLLRGEVFLNGSNLLTCEVKIVSIMPDQSYSIS